MPRHYKRVSNYASWSEEAMLNAINAVRQKTMTLNQASNQFGIPKGTLWRHVNNHNHGLARDEKKSLGRFKPVFSTAQEEELVQHILSMEARLFGLTTKDVRYIAFNLAKRNGIAHNFNKESGLAGEDWLVGFLQRNPQLALRTPEATSAARARCFNANNVSKFFDLLEGVIDDHKFPVHRIFNCDETGINTVQTKPSKVLAQRGKSQVGSLTSAERGILTTAVICMSASGSYVPPFLIFPRARRNVLLMEGAPPGTGFAFDKSGWMQQHIFSQWMQHFIDNVKPTATDPVLLLLDGHATHVKNLDVIDLARKNHITLLVFPPHCTHRLQPLDVAFMKPLKTYYSQEIEKWLRNNPGRVVSVHQVSKLFGAAYLRAATPAIAIKGFEATGIQPVNRHVFSESDFVAAVVTDNANIESSTLSNADGKGLIVEPMTSPHVSDAMHEVTNTINENIQMLEDGLLLRIIDLDSVNANSSDVNVEPIVPVAVDANDELKEDVTVPSSFANGVSPSSIIALPRVATSVRTVTRRKHGATAVVTSDQYRESLAQQLPCSSNNVGIKRRKVANIDVTPDANCLYCAELFSASKARERWIQCSSCQKWAHEECAGSENKKQFICELCL